MASDSATGGSSAIEVFWRPGCPYCQDLRGLLLDYEVEATWRNIWSDPDAREVVRAANRGNETVPTVRVGEVTLTNPTWRQLAKALDRDHREPPRPIPPRAYASAGSCTVPSSNPRPEILSVGVLLIAGFVVLLDLLTKAWAGGRLTNGQHLSSGPITLQLVHNPGIGYGFGAGSPALATVISMLGLAALALALVRSTGPTVKAAFAMAAAGGLSNLIDRLAHGTVTDWIHVAGYPPIFNLADLAVRGGLLVALVGFFWPHRGARRFGKQAYRTSSSDLGG